MKRISKETSVALKDIAYDALCNSFYFGDETEVTTNTKELPIEKDEDDYAAPYQDEAIDYLRNKCSIMVTVYANASGYLFEIHDTPSKGGSHRFDSGYTGNNDSGCWDIYEDAKEAGIRKAIDIYKAMELSAINSQIKKGK